MNDMHAGGIAAPALTDNDVRLIIIGVLLAIFLAALDQTIVATALPTIGRQLGDPELLPWVVTSYLVTATAVTPLYGKMSDIVGRRIMLLAGIGTFILGSVACALAPTMVTLILARALQGVGGGGLISLAQTIIGDIVPPRERGSYQVYIASVFVSSSLLGPVLGGFMAEHLHWSMIFWINVPLGLGAFAMTWGLLRRLPRHERPHKLDWLGAILLILATTSLLLALNWGGTRYPWLSSEVLGALAASLVLWVLFALRLGSADEPLIPLSLFANTVIRWATLAACLGMGTFIALTIYMPVFFETQLGLSAATSGLALIPLMVGTVIGANISGRAMMKLTHYRRVPVAGLCVAMAGALLLALAQARLSLWSVMAVTGIMSLGLGSLLPVTTVSIQNAVSLHQLGTATAGNNFFRSLGGALLIAAFGAIVLGGDVAGGLHGPAIGGGSSPQLAGAFRHMFLAAALTFALSLVFLLRMEERPLQGRAERELAAK
jgi:EmrB/QacA subfamily drug resistance transporter